jgi:DNA-binding LacI/PurR family transcriptional regulator
MSKLSQPILIQLRSGEPLAEQLRRQLTWQIASGHIKPGDLLPPVRHLAQQLSINLHTVRSAYRRLEQDGLVRTQQGAGTRVLQLDPLRLVELAGRTRTYTIGVILPGLSNPFYHSMLQGVEQGIQREQILVFVCNAHEDPQELFRYFAQLSARNVDGIIVASFDSQDFLGDGRSPGLPVVWVDCPGCRGPAVNFDLERAAYLAVHHLLAHAHQRIGLITFKEDSANVAEMHAGYHRALREAGISPDETLIARMPDFLMPSGEQGVQQLMAVPQPPTAIFAIADTLALGALLGLQRGGWQVPQQVALASLNDIALAELVNPPLTTVALPAHRLGLEAAKMLLDLMNGAPLPHAQITLPVELITRQSCGCNAEKKEPNVKR